METNTGDDEEPLKTPQKLPTLKKNRKLYKFRFLSETNLHNVRRDQIIVYILSLHKKVRSLLKKCKRYREKIRKLDVVARTNLTPAEKSSIDKTTEVETNDTESGTNSFIADIKNAAHQAQNEMGFIYEPTSGLYYDSRTGYYYNAEHGLYYDGNNGCYYSYNQAENKFEFHSQVYSTDETASAKDEKVAGVDNLMQQFEHLDLVDRYRANALVDGDSLTRKRRKSTDSYQKSVSQHKNRKRPIISDSELKEDGEISDENDSDNDSSRDYPIKLNSQRKHIVYEISDDSCSSSASGRNSPYSAFSDIAKKYPPSLRIVVSETNIRKLKIGELFLITYKGGSLGREGKHDVIIPDINCSKYHLRFAYDENKGGYTCTDLGSRNGTVMNGKRMSNAKQESETMQLLHGTILQIGQTKLLCHIHDGHSTCGQCEPGLLGDNSIFNECADAVSSGSGKQKSANVTEDHKRQLKNLKKRYGLQDEKYVAPKMDGKNDRAEQRRRAVGSSCEHEKTKAASLNTSISNENKGFKMLSKLGWSEGQSLGKNNDGLLEPIPLKMNDKKQGLGCESSSMSSSISITSDPKRKHKARILEKTHQRYHASEAKVDIFKHCSDESD